MEKEKSSLELIEGICEKKKLISYLMLKGVNSGRQKSFGHLRSLPTSENFTFNIRKRLINTITVSIQQTRSKPE